MKWKNLSNWLKGGIVSTSIFVFSIIILIILANLNSNTHPDLPVKEIPGLGTAVIFTLIFYAIVFFGIGSLIGLIISKVNSKK